MRRPLVAVGLAALFGASLVLGGQRAAEADGAGGAAAGPYILRLPGIAGDVATGTTFDPGMSASGVRHCRFLPGVSMPAQLPPAPVKPEAPGPSAPPNNPVAPDVSQAQVLRFNALFNTVVAKYVDPNFNGLDLDTLGDEYEAKILAGLTEEAFGDLMKLFIRELDDDHSHYQTAAEVLQEEEELAHGTSLVGIGVSVLPLADGTASVIYVFPGGPADLAGIRPHDHLVGVNGGPFRLADGSPATVGEAGTSLTVQVRRGTAPVFSVSMVRAAITAPAPVDSCLVAGTGIGYIFLPTFFDNTIDAQVRDALQKLMAEGPLNGLIFDNRLNGGGLESEAKGVLGFVTSGYQGAYVSQGGSNAFNIKGEPIGNSQTVPLVVLTGSATASYGEIFSGVLKEAGRATIVGLTTKGNVELLNSTMFDDGSRVWLAQQTFQPVGLPAGAWEDSGIVADVLVHGEWHEFTELDDPGLARAIQVLMD